MPTRVTNLNVFIASPSDVIDERSLLEDLELATESINRISALLQELNQKTQENTTELTQLPKPINPNQAKPIVNRQADTWESFAQRVEVELPFLSSKFRSGIDSYTKAAQILNDFETKDIDQVKTGLEAITYFKEVIIEAQESTKHLRDIVQIVPRMTTHLNHAKRRIVEVLDKILEEYDAEENLAAEAEKVILEILRRMDSELE